MTVMDEMWKNDQQSSPMVLGLKARLSGEAGAAALQQLAIQAPGPSNPGSKLALPGTGAGIPTPAQPQPSLRPGPGVSSEDPDEVRKRKLAESAAKIVNAREEARQKREDEKQRIQAEKEAKKDLPETKALVWASGLKKDSTNLLVCSSITTWSRSGSAMALTDPRSLEMRYCRVL